VHWPAGIKARGELRLTPGHVIDFVPTVLELVGAKLELKWNGTEAPPLSGRSLLSAFATDAQVPRDFLFFHHDLNRALRVGDWKLVSRRPETNNYALYNLAADRSELNDLAAQEPERLRAMAAKWAELEKQFRAQAEARP
jgi:arylsulfatase